MDIKNEIGSPVLICGYPKSGTTLLLALLDSHPQLLVFPEETRYFKNMLNRPDHRNLDYVYSSTSVRTFGQGQIARTSGKRDYSDIDYAAYKRTLEEHWHFTQQAAIFHQGSLLESIVYSYGKVTNQLGKKYWVEKTPLNEKYLADIVDLWPSLKALYIIRDPRDNYCSYSKLRNKRHLGRKEKFANADKETRKKEMRPPLTIGEFAAYWLDSIYHYWKQFESQYKNACMVIRYEDLVEQPEMELKRICEFLQVSWHDSLYIPSRNGIPWSGNSMHGDQFNGISTASIGRYREILTDEEISSLEGILRKTMLHYGWSITDIEVSLMKLLNLLFSSDTSPYVKSKIMIGLLRQLLAKE